MKTKLFCAAKLVGLASSGKTTLAHENKKIKLPISQNNFNDPIEIECCSGKKDNTVRLSPNPTTNGTLTITSIVNEAIHFYVFDLEGSLVHQVVLKGKQQRTINKLNKGTYTYDVFKNDESIEQGKIIVK